LVFAIFPLLLGFGLYLLLKPAPSDEDQIRAAIQAVAQGARARNIGEAMAPISRGYRDEDGLSYDNLKGFLFREFQRGQGISVMLGPITIELDPDGQTAWADLDVALAEGIDVSNLEIFPTNADVLHFEVELKRDEEDEWKVMSQTNAPVR